MGSIFWFLGIIFFLNGMLRCMANANVHYYNFVLKETKFTRLCSTKSMLTVNGSFPGPTIRVHKGDTVYVNVHNQGKYGVTIHWHGVKQPRNPWSDGPENITQCPIPPNTSFTQQIIFSDEEGTLWWHAHSDWSRATVHGAIIILPAPETTYPFPQPYAEETIVLGEWYKGDVMAIIDEALATGGDPNISDAFTINGQPGDLYNCSKVKSNQALSHYYIVTTPFADTNAPYDNTTATAILQYRGKYTAPSSPRFPTLPSYNDKAAAENFTKLLRSLASKEHPVKVPKTITKSIFITVSVNQLYCPNGSCDGPDGNRLSASLNNISFQTPKIDILQAYYRNLPNVYTNNFPKQPPYYFNFTGDVGNNTIYPSLGTKVLTINYNDSVEIVFQGTNIGAAENHPMHLHGFSFYVVGIGSGNFNNKTSPKSYNLVDPPEVNTIGVPKNGWLAIRFIANNPGVWFMHCHLERHASWGMNTVLIVKNGGTNATSIRPPPKYMPPCSKS